MSEPQTSYLTGRKPVLEGLLEHAPLDQVFLQQGLSGLDDIVAACHQTKIRFRFVSKKELDSLFKGNHQGVLARQTATTLATTQQAREAALHAKFPVFLALDQVQDTGNLGTLARTLHAFGGTSILVPKNRSAFLGPGAMKASAGAIRKLYLAQAVNLGRELDACQAEGYTVYGATMHENSKSLYQTRLTWPAVLVLGNEEKGLRQGIIKRCDHLCHIPLPAGFDSLNVAQAGAVFLGEFLRQMLQQH